MNKITIYPDGTIVIEPVKEMKEFAKKNTYQGPSLMNPKNIKIPTLTPPYEIGDFPFNQGATCVIHHGYEDYQTWLNAALEDAKEQEKEVTNNYYKILHDAWDKVIKDMEEE